MDFDIFLPNNEKIQLPVGVSANKILSEIGTKFNLKPDELYLVQNGKRISSNETHIQCSGNVYAQFRLLGGKGGFGSMLRAIGAQIEKTTNREACRDLSGRRLRDINEEKRLKNWLDSQKEREQKHDDKVKKKIQKLQAKPKHEFKDEHYEQARSDLTENIATSVEKGFEIANQMQNGSTSGGIKRKGPETNLQKKKPKKAALWIGDDLSSSSDTDTDSDTEKPSEKTKKNEIKITEPIIPKEVNICSKSLASSDASN